MSHFDAIFVILRPDHVAVAIKPNCVGLQGIQCPHLIVVDMPPAANDQPPHLLPPACAYAIDPAHALELVAYEIDKLAAAELAIVRTRLERNLYIIGTPPFDPIAEAIQREERRLKVILAPVTPLFAETPAPRAAPVWPYVRP